MKLERISENQIRCTLNSEDLTERDMNLGELAYGSEKARSLFREMLQRASYELDFQSEDAPLMIEAIPLAGNGVMLLITRADDPEELDTRFSKFAPMHDDSIPEEPDDSEDVIQRADEILNLFHQLTKTLGQTENGEPSGQPEDPIGDLVQIYRFHELDAVSEAAAAVPDYHGISTLYKDRQTANYYLAVHKSDHTPEEFNCICNMLNEFSDSGRSISTVEAYFEEHMEIISSPNALQVFRNL